MTNLTYGPLLARNAIWNLIGMAVPVLVALVAIPLLIEGMGKERFGLLAIIWMGVGYFSLFDLGIGRALTKLVSERIGSNDVVDLGPLIWTACIVLAVLGIAGAILVYFVSPLLVTRLLDVPDIINDESIAAFRILAAGIPIVIVSAGFAGILEAHQKFKNIAHIRIPLGVLTFAGPLMTLQFTPSIAWATAVLLVCRFLAMIAYYLSALQVRQELRNPMCFDLMHVKPLLSFGGWLTVTNIVSPLMTYMDRFFIGAKLGLPAVTDYVTPYEVLARMQMLPQAIMGVLFPAMTIAHSGDESRLKVLYKISGKVLYWIMLPILAGVFLLGPEALRIWLGNDLGNTSIPVLQLLATGWMIHILALPAYAVLLATGHPDLTAKTHLAELVPYISVLWWFTHLYGIVGVAIAWAMRVIFDAVILNILAARKMIGLRNYIKRNLFVMLLTLMFFGAFWFITALDIRILILILIFGSAVSILWPIIGQVYRGFLYTKPLGA